MKKEGGKHSSREEQPSMKNIGHDVVHDLIHFDSKLFRTVPLLLFKPGELTVRSLKGDAAYVKPFGLFVFFNFVFFIVKVKNLFPYVLNSYTYDDLFNNAIAKKVAELHIPYHILEERFNMAMRFEEKEYLIIMVPLFALLVQLLYIFKIRNYALHLVFALNFYAWFIILLILLPWIFVLIAWIMKLFHANAHILNDEAILVWTLATVCFAYLLFAIRKVYQDKWWLAVIKAGLLSFSVIALIVLVFKPVLFFIVMHSVGE